MHEETKKYVERTIERLEAIYNSASPWNVREQLKEFNAELKKLL